MRALLSQKKVEADLLLRKVRGEEFFRKSVVLHRSKITLAVPPDRLISLCAAPRGSGRKPDDMVITFPHNYKHKPMAELSLLHLGITDYAVEQPPEWFKWKGGLPKLLLLQQLLRGPAGKKKYLFYLDAADSIMLQSPVKGLELLEETGADILFGNTVSDKDRFLIPTAFELFDRVATEKGFGPGSARYLNAGVFVAKVEYLKAIVDEMCVGFDFTNCTTRLSVNDLLKRKNAGENIDVAAALENLDNDQTYFRRIQARDYPRIQVSYDASLAIR